MAKKVIMIGDRKFHIPFVDLIPYDDAQMAELKRSIEEMGGVQEPIVCWKEKHKKGEDVVVEGAHRTISVSELGLGKIPMRLVSFKSEAEAKDYCIRANVDRRQLTVAQQQEYRQDRIQRVADQRAEGKSIRTIAEEEGISKSQVEKDLKAAEDKGLDTKPTNGKVLGADGRTQPAKKRNKTPEPPKRDQFRNEVPKKLRPVFFDPWLYAAYDSLCLTADNLRKARLADGFKKRLKVFPFFKEEDCVDALYMIDNALSGLIDHINKMRPAGVCPKCGGEGCASCKMSGLVPRELYGKLKEEKEKADKAEKAKK